MMNKPRGLKRKVMGFVVLITVFVAILGFAGDFLVVNDRPVQSDAIIVLGGGPMARVARGAQLYHSGYSHRLILSGGAVYNPEQSQAEHMRQEALRLGVPASSILLECKSQTTLQNAEYTLQIMKMRHFRSAIVVSSDFHMRRASMDFSHVFSGSGITLTYSSSSYPSYYPSRWWTTSVGRKLTILEYGKILYTIIVDFVWIPVRHTI